MSSSRRVRRFRRRLVAILPVSNGLFVRRHSESIGEIDLGSLREEGFEDVAVALAVAPSSVEFPLHDVTDAKPLVGARPTV